MGGFYAGLGDELSLWVRQIAWLNAAPEQEHKGKGKPLEPKTRLETMRERGEAPLLPHNPAQYLTDWLFEIGPMIGGETVTYRDLAAWQAISGVELLPVEAKIIRQLSGAYASEQHQARKMDRPAPYSGEQGDIEDNRDRVARQVRAAFGGLRKRG